MYVKIFVNFKVFAIRNQESEPWEPIGNAGLPFFNSHDGTIKADEWATKVAQ